MVKNYFGIDFGTTNSALVSYSVMGDEVIACRKYGDDLGRPIPSVVAIDRNTGDVYVGREAKESKEELSETCEYISSVKSILDDEIVYDIAGRKWSTVDVVAEIFKNLKAKVGNIEDFTEAIVSIPVGFSAKKRQKLREAAKQAGIDIKSFVAESTAAFFANYDDLKSSNNVVIFDWGGGTLDISVLKHERRKIFELATVGNNVAGDDLDKKIARRMHEKVAGKQEKKIAFDDMPNSAKDLMLGRCERAKCTLSMNYDANIRINNYGEYRTCRESLDYVLFKLIIEPEVNQALSYLEKAIEQSGVGLANIDKIVMVGGSSNLRPLREKLQEKYGEQKIYYPEDTSWSVAQGAARLSYTPGGYYSNQSVGIILDDGSYYELLAPNTAIEGWKQTYHFGITDYVEEARFVFSGSADIDSSADKYKVLTVPNYKFLQEVINLEVSVDENQVLQAWGSSNIRSKKYRRLWEYSSLKYYYQLK